MGKQTSPLSVPEHSFVPRRIARNLAVFVIYPLFVIAVLGMVAAAVFATVQLIASRSASRRMAELCNASSSLRDSDLRQRLGYPHETLRPSGEGRACTSENMCVNSQHCDEIRVYHDYPSIAFFCLARGSEGTLAVVRCTVVTDE